MAQRKFYPDRKIISRLNEALSGHNLTWWAEYMDMDRKSLSEVANGHRYPNLYVLLNICSESGYSADYILGLSPERARGGGQ